MFVCLSVCSYHSVVKDTIGHGFPGIVLCVEGLADHVEMGLLPHLLGREETKLQMATGGGEEEREGRTEDGGWRTAGISQVLSQGVLLQRSICVLV